MPANKSIFDHSFKPVYQGLMVVSIYIVLLLVILILKFIHWIELEPLDYWKFSTSLVLFYIMVSCIFCFTAKEKITYYRNALFTYAAIIFTFTGISNWFSGISLFQAESYSWILTVFSIIFIVMLTIINLVRKIVEIAIKQDNKIKDEK